MRIAAILTVFPSLTETFVYGDLRALKEAGHDLALLRFLDRRDTVWQEDAQVLRGSILSGGRLVSTAVLVDAGRVLLAHPFETARVVTRILMHRQVSWRAFLKTLIILPRCLQMVREVQNWQADLVHATWANHSAVAAMIIQAIADIPYSISAHAGQDVFREPFMLKEKVEGAKFVSVCNRHAMERLVAESSPHAREKIQYVPHGVDLRRFPMGREPHLESGKRSEGRDQGRRNAATAKILFVGRLQYGKGLPYLLQAIQLMKQRNVDFTLEIIGQGPDEAALCSEVKERELASLVCFRGAVSQDEVARSLAGAEMLVLPSEIRRDGGREGLPNVILEAMACGTPVVATRIASIDEAIEDGMSGLLVPQKDAGALADAMRRLLDDSHLRRRLAENGRQVVAERFDRHHWHKAFISLFEAAE